MSERPGPYLSVAITEDGGAYFIRTEYERALLDAMHEWYEEGRNRVLTLTTVAGETLTIPASFVRNVTACSPETDAARKAWDVSAWGDPDDEEEAWKNA